MLYRTHHNPFLFTSSLSPHLVPPPSLQGMEVVPETVKGGVLPETASFGDEFCGGVNGDDFFVDELLDFSNGFSETEELEEKKEIVSVSVSEEKKQIEAYENSVVLYGKDEFGSLPVTEMNPQDEGLESLEWLSHFVEESFSEYPLTGKLPPAAVPPCFTSSVQTKARTKRARTGVRVWPVLSDSSTSSGSSTSSTTSFPVKERKKLAGAGAGGQQRRCSHCGVTKTPQWRAGPHGPKTLCNACGVRFKSGRLLPEYRPACSPTYSSDLHSNNHRKVMEMRRKRETGPSSTGFAPPVQSF